MYLCYKYKALCKNELEVHVKVYTKAFPKVEVYV